MIIEIGGLYSIAEVPEGMVVCMYQDPYEKDNFVVYSFYEDRNISINKDKLKHFFLAIDSRNPEKIINSRILNAIKESGIDGQQLLNTIHKGRFNKNKPIEEYLWADSINIKFINKLINYLGLSLTDIYCINKKSKYDY